MTTSRPKSRCRGTGPCAPSGTSFSLVASWLTPSNLLKNRSSSVATRPRVVALGHFLVLGHRVVLKDFALEDPDLDAAGAECGERGRNPVIDVGAQRVQGHAAFAIPFHARDFGATETA